MKRATGGYTRLNFGRNLGGYTLAEVLMAMAVATLIFISGLIAFRSEQGDAEFSQAMHDLESKIKSYVVQISAGSIADTDRYTCSINSNRPELRVQSGGLGTNEQCIFLGRAFQVIPEHNEMYVYTVLGARINPTTQLPAKSFDEASPEPARLNTGSLVLIDDYRILGGATIRSSRVSGLGVENDLIGIYSSLQNDSGVSSSTGSASLLFKGYERNFTDHVGPPTDDNTIRSCIEDTGPAVSACGGPNSINAWVLCVQSSERNQTAVLSLNSQASGLTTQLKFANC